jgi:hypothetical protein
MEIYLEATWPVVTFSTYGCAWSVALKWLTVTDLWRVVAPCQAFDVQKFGKMLTVPCKVTREVTRVSNLAQPKTRLPFTVPQDRVSHLYLKLPHANTLTNHQASAFYLHIYIYIYTYIYIYIYIYIYSSGIMQLHPIFRGSSWNQTGLHAFTSSTLPT